MSDGGVGTFVGTSAANRCAMTVTIDPEYATVGGLMLAPEHYDTVAGWLQPEDFARPLCGEIYQLLGEMRGRDLPIDPVTVLGQLREHGRLRSDGYPGTELVGMIQAVPVPDSTPYYGRLVLAASVFRRIGECGTRLGQVGRLARGTPDDAFDALAGSWQTLADVRQRWQQASGRTTERAPSEVARTLRRPREAGRALAPTAARAGH